MNIEEEVGQGQGNETGVSDDETILNLLLTFCRCLDHFQYSSYIDAAIFNSHTVMYLCILQ